MQQALTVRASIMLERVPKVRYLGHKWGCRLVREEDIWRMRRLTYVAAPEVLDRFEADLEKEGYFMRERHEAEAA